MKWFLNLFQTKPVYAILLIAVILVLIYIAYKVISGAIAKAKQTGNYNAAVNQSQTALNQLAQQGVKPSYGEAQYSTWADALEKAFSGCGAGYSTVVEPTLQQMKNDADVYALIQKYGVRSIDECGWGSFNGDLGATLGYKFSGWTFCGSLICGTISDINKILKSKGIVFQF